MIPVIFLILGLILLIGGANWLVTGASSLAKKYKMSDLAIGLTIVAFGTSAPELVVNILASVQNHSDIILGNVIGSNNFNLFVILGIAGIITPLVVQSSTVWKEIPLSLFAIILFLLIANISIFNSSTIITRTEGLILLTFFGLFLFYIYKNLKKDTDTVERVLQKMSSFKIFFYIIAGLSGLIFGGHLLVKYAVKLATEFGMSEKMIGLTIVATGTSLPELATSIVAAIKKNNDIAVGNIIGSNIFNVFLILGVSSIIRPIHFNVRFNNDIYFLAAGTVFLFIAMFMGKKKKLDRWEATLLLLSYLVYSIFIVLLGA